MTTINGALGIIGYAYQTPVYDTSEESGCDNPVQLEFNLNQNEVAELICTLATHSACRWWYQVNTGDLSWLGPSSGQFTTGGANTYTVKTLVKANSAGTVNIQTRFGNYSLSSPYVTAGLLLVRVVGRLA